LENLNYSGEINRAWDNIKENVKISAKETLGLYGWKQAKLWFDECTVFRSNALVTGSNQSNLDNVSSRLKDANHQVFIKFL
jgi:hypothetical protein